MLRWSMILLLLCACGTDEERFPEQVARTWCAEFKSCDIEDFFRQYRDGTPQCQESVAVEVLQQAFPDGDRACFWIDELGEQCIDALAKATCDEVLNPLWLDECTAAWDCVTIVSARASARPVR